MKLIILSTFTLLLPLTSLAQNYPGMTQEQMKTIDDMQTCIENVDQSQLRSIEERQYQFEEEVYALCGSGDREQAQQKALAFEKEMSENPALKAMKKCEEMARGMITGIIREEREEELASNRHICDSL